MFPSCPKVADCNRLRAHSPERNNKKAPHEGAPVPNPMEGIHHIDSRPSLTDRTMLQIQTSR